ncbi:hypothetical protein JB92DRAFT_3108726 [Gautieria morchelliformis]|nr:hypothetical protein JB92DRAFT_3108726 [Gautieria morchelliformis]
MKDTALKPMTWVSARWTPWAMILRYRLTVRAHVPDGRLDCLTGIVISFQSASPTAASPCHRSLPPSCDLAGLGKGLYSPECVWPVGEYIGRPSYDPDSVLPMDEWVPQVNTSSGATESIHPTARAAFWPFPNISQFLLGDWYINSPSGEHSGRDFDNLIHVLQDKWFDPGELEHFSHRKLSQVLDGIDTMPDILPGEPNGADGWKWNVSVSISIPEAKKHRGHSPGGRDFHIPDLYCRSICAIIKKVFSTARDLHFTPFEWYHQGTGDSAQRERLWGELFCSEAWNQEHKQLPQEPGCKLEQVIAPLMFWSDLTHLTSFGTAKLWPIYMFFGSQSKYSRSAHLSHHVADIPLLPDSIQDFIRNLTGGHAARPPLLTHCRHELMHALWQLLLDNEFVDAYKHGIVIKCADGITRRVYPRIFTYSADYPEKQGTV